MTRRRKPRQGLTGPSWIDTYADMVTLLLTFFVLLFAMSSVNEEKWKMIVEAFTDTPNAIQVEVGDKDKLSGGMYDSFGDKPPIVKVPASPNEIKNFDDLYAYLNAYVKENGLGSDIQLYDGDGYTFITFRNNILFDGNSAYLKWQGQKILDVLGDALVNVTELIDAIRFEGHTARAGTVYSDRQSLFDRQLSSDRAVNVLYYMQRKDLLAPEKLTSTGHGEFKPLMPHDGTETTRIVNRRVEIIIIEDGADDKPLEEIYKEVYGEYPVSSDAVEME